MITEKVLEGMFKPVQSPWKTSITKVEPNKLTTRGYKQEDLSEVYLFQRWYTCW